MSADITFEQFLNAILKAASRRSRILRDEDYMEILSHPLIRDKLCVIENICAELAEDLKLEDDSTSLREWVKDCVLLMLESILHVEGMRSPEYYRQVYERFRALQRLLSR
jgi:hypothetical protein